MKEILILFCFCGVFNSLFSQTRLQGKVISPQHDAIALATVRLFALPDSSLVAGASTHEDGLFTIENAPQGNYYLQVSFIGYETIGIPVSVGANQPNQTVPDIVLLEDAQSLREVVVSAQRQVIEHRTDRTVMHVQNLPTAAGASALELLERAPNMQADRTNGQLYMNGKAGVLVAINGKTQRMDSDALLQYLAAVPSANIESIEFIHTPPAAYEATGSAGVINIRMKALKNEGFNGAFTLGGGYGLDWKGGSDLHLEGRKKSVSAYLDLSTENNRTRENTHTVTGFTLAAVATKNELWSERPAFRGLQSVRAGVDFQVTPKTNMGFLLNGYLNQWSLDARTTTDTEDSEGRYSRSILYANERNNWLHGMVNTHIQHDFSKKTRLTADVDYLSYVARNPTRYRNSDFDRNGTVTDSARFESAKRTPLHFFVAHVDLAHQINDRWQIETGLKNTVSDFTNELRLTRFENEQAVDDPEFTTTTRLDEAIRAAYFSGKYATGKTSVQFGLRFEYTRSLLNNDKNERLADFNFGRFFPTISMERRLSERQRVSASYSERIGRPAFNWIALAFFFFAPNMALGGNPGIRPSRDQQLSLQYSHSAFSMTLQLSESAPTFGFQPTLQREENFFLFRMENVARMRQAMLAASHQMSRKWWSSNLNLSLFHTEIHPRFEGKSYRISNWHWQFSIAQTFKLPQHFSLELSNQSVTRRVFSFGYALSQYTTNLGIQKNWGQQHRLSLTWSDIFNRGTHWKWFYDRPELNLRFNQAYDTEGSVMRLTYRCQMGNQKLKAMANRKTASEAERARMN